MSPTRRFARNTGLNLLGQGLPLLAALPAIPLLIAGAGTERFGLLAIAWAVIGYMGVLDLGVSRALTWSVAERVGRGRVRELPGLVRGGVRLAAGVGVGVGFALLLASSPLARLLTAEGTIREETVLAIRVMALCAPLVVLTGVLRGVLEGLHRFGTVNAIRIPLGVATFLAPAAVLPWTDHLGALVGALLLARLLGWAGYRWAVARAFVPISGDGGSDAAPSETATLLRYGGWATVSNVVGPLLVTFDRVAVGVLLGGTVVAFYTTPFEIVYRLLIIPTAVVAVFFPAFAQGAVRSTTLFRGSVEGILLLVVPPALLLFAFAPEGLALWVGDDFARASSGVARWLAVGVVVNAVGHVPFTFIQGSGRPKVAALIHILELPVYAVALFWALTRWGIEGAAMVWVGRATVDLVLMLRAGSALAPELRGAALRTLALTAAGVATLLVATLPGLGLSGRVAWVALVSGAALVLAWRRYFRSFLGEGARL